MAGRLVREGGDMCFVPRFAFVEGTAYTVTVGGAVAATLVRARRDQPATTTVVSIRPTSAKVPRNLLRFYVWFSAPMSEGCAARHVRLGGDDGSAIAGALLSTEHELWDPSRRRLTVLLDPARIKRGLAGHRAAGYPLRAGQPAPLGVGGRVLDAAGGPPGGGPSRPGWSSGPGCSTPRGHRWRPGRSGGTRSGRTSAATSSRPGGSWPSRPPAAARRRPARRSGPGG